MTLPRIPRWITLMALILSAEYALVTGFRAHERAKACAVENSAVPAKGDATHEALIIETYCDNASKEVRLRSKTAPYTETTVFVYDVDSTTDERPQVAWLGPKDLQISTGRIKGIERQVAARDGIAVHYNIEGVY